MSQSSLPWLLPSNRVSALEPDFPSTYHLSDESDGGEEESVYADSEFGDCVDQAEPQVGLPAYL